MVRRLPSTPDAGRRTPHARPQGAGFSLIEVLVVMGIIAFLTAAIVVILPRVANASKIAATRATIKKVDELLNDRINGFQRWIQTQNTLAGGNVPSYVLSSQYASLYKQNPLLYQILATKAAFRTSFPQSFSEMTTAPPYNTATHKQVTESAACLYLILTQGAIFDTEPPAAAELKGLEVADTDGDGLMEVVDAWGHPLRYYRWPTRLFRPATSTSSVATAQVGTTNWNNLAPAPAPTPASILITSAPRPPLSQWTHTSYTLGTIIQPATIVQGSPPVANVMTYQCTTAGTSGGTEPNPWGTSVGGSTNDGPVVWQAALDPLAVDSDDPNGLASSTLVNESTFHTWGTYHVTLIVSCGTDETLGLYEPYDTTNFGNLGQPQFGTSGFANDALYDDITNHQQ